MSAYGGYSTTSYGAGGGEDGGGFVWGSQGGSQSGAKPINDESLRPVTIKQIIDAEPAYAGDASFRIDGLDVKQVTIVGMVRAISLQTTNITYKIDDGTGVIEVKQWLDADRQQQQQDGSDEQQQAFKEEEYVRVWGRLKHFNNKRHIGAHVIKPVRDFNEVNYHLLEATYVHLFITRGAATGGGAGAGAGAGAAAAGDGDSMFVDSGAGSYNSFSAKAKKVYGYMVKVCSANVDINAYVIARETGMSVQDVMNATEELRGFGAIFNTIDEETFNIL